MSSRSVGWSLAQLSVGGVRPGRRALGAISVEPLDTSEEPEIGSERLGNRGGGVVAHSDLSGSGVQAGHRGG